MKEWSEERKDEERDEGNKKESKIGWSGVTLMIQSLCFSGKVQFLSKQDMDESIC